MTFLIQNDSDECVKCESESMWPRMRVTSFEIFLVYLHCRLLIEGLLFVLHLWNFLCNKLSYPK